MIKIGGKDISLVSIGSVSIMAIVMKGKKVWESIRSCFGRGWNDNKPWVDNEGWS